MLSSTKAPTSSVLSEVQTLFLSGSIEPVSAPATGSNCMVWRLPTGTESPPGAKFWLTASSAAGDYLEPSEDDFLPPDRQTGYIPDEEDSAHKGPDPP